MFKTLLMRRAPASAQNTKQNLRTYKPTNLQTYKLLLPQLLQYSFKQIALPINMITTVNKAYTITTERDAAVVAAEKNQYGWNPLHYACQNNASLGTVTELLKVGGKGFATAQDEHGWNPLHVACNNTRLSNDMEILDLLIQYGGGEILMQMNYAGMTPLGVLITKFFGYSTEEEMRSWVKRISFLTTKGIELQVGGEYSIGGLFNCNNVEQQVKDRVYNNYWDHRVLPALEQVMALPSTCRQCHPILQAIIMDGAPPHIIKNVVNRFPDCVNTVDSSGKYPIHIAARHGLPWDDGMKEIVDAFASTSTRKTTALHVCARHGVQWQNGMKEVLERSRVGDVEREDVSSGLYPFMLAAVGGDKNSHDLDSIFHLVKKTPLLVQKFGDNEESEQSSRKTKKY